mmetsp:Transcript_15752/g.38624  ORF Transcript_15752/g.38624 Transcript_15752/m.38624 type:complete len:136 (-) Transcript_15752:764-1171(-)
MEVSLPTDEAASNEGVMDGKRATFCDRGASNESTREDAKDRLGDDGFAGEAARDGGRRSECTRMRDATMARAVARHAVQSAKGIPSPSGQSLVQSSVKATAARAWRRRALLLGLCGAGARDGMQGEDTPTRTSRG